MSSDIDHLVALFHRRWAVPVLAEMALGGGGAKFVTLVNRLGVGRETLHATLEDLIAMGVIRRNTGYGHPMRPEYVFTPRGERLAPSATNLLDAVRRLDIERLAFRKWTMPVTYALGRDDLRFNELRDELPGITPRALTLSLKDMQDANLVRREVWDEYPPTTSYKLERRGGRVLNVLRPLAMAV